MKISTYWKAVIAAVTAGAGALGTALADNTLTAAEGWVVAGAILGALGFTWAVPNRAPATGEDTKA